MYGCTNTGDIRTKFTGSEVKELAEKFHFDVNMFEKEEIEEVVE